jgi:hypothetical protein
MDNVVITFTPEELITSVITICGLITAVAAVITLMINLTKKAKLPNIRQDERISKCEERLDDVEALMENDSKRFDRIEESNRIIQKSILALLEHGIDGNNVEAMKKAKDSLNEYLIMQ